MYHLMVSSSSAKMEILLLKEDAHGLNGKVEENDEIYGNLL